MTQKLKISVQETMESIVTIPVGPAARIMYDEYVKKDSSYNKKQGFLPETINRSLAYGWSIKKREVITRPATISEVIAYHKNELKKAANVEGTWPVDEIRDILKGKEFVLEVVEV